MRDGETELDMVRRHVREGEAHVQRQREIIRRIREAGNSTDDAEDLLDRFEQTQAEHMAHLDRLTRSVR